MSKARWISILLFFAIFSTASYANQADSYVGIRQFSVYFQPTQSEIKSIVWYPTPEKSQMTKIGPYELDVAKNAQMESGKHILVVISHGSGGSHLGHQDTAIYLAKRGYIVISVLHPKNNYFDDSAGRTNENWAMRPRHISRVLDSILNDSYYQDYIKKDKIAVIGHSAGGYTALALVGGIPDTAAIDIHCRNHNDDTEFCGAHNRFFMRIKHLFSIRGSKSSNIIDNLYDQRIKAAVLLAPPGVLFKDEASLSRVKVPIRMYRAEKDEVLRYPYHAESIKQKLTIMPEYVIVKNAGHYSFLSPFPNSKKNEIGVPAEDPEGFDRVAFHTQLNEEIYEFLSNSLG